MNRRTIIGWNVYVLFAGNTATVPVGRRITAKGRDRLVRRWRETRGLGVREVSYTLAYESRSV